MAENVEKGRMLHIRLAESTHRQLRILAATAGTTLQDYVEDLLVSDLLRMLKKEKPTVAAPNVTAV